MSFFRKDPTEAERATAESAVRERMEARRKEAEAKAAAAAEEAKKNRPPADPLMPKVVLGGVAKRLSAEEVAASAAIWRAQYSRYDNAEIVKLMEAKLTATLTADGYAVPKQPEKDRLKELLQRQAAKGK